MPNNTLSITIPSSQLREAVQRAARTAAQKTTLPILSNVVVTSSAAGLSIRSTDQTMGTLVTVSVPDVDGYGATCVNARDLADTVKGLPDCDVELTASANHALTISAKGRKLKVKLPGMPAEDFPAEVVVKGEPQEIAAPALRRLIEAVRHAISSDDTRPHLAALLLRTKAPKLQAVATDGHRLATATYEWGGDLDVLVPFRAVAELYELTTSKLEVITLRTDGVHLVAEAGPLALTLKLATESFPPWEKVQPKTWAHAITVPRLDLIGAIKRMGRIGGTKQSDGVRFIFNDGEMTIEAENPDKGEGSETLACDNDGAEFVMGMSARYAVEALSALLSDDACLCAAEDQPDLSPLRVHEPGDSDTIQTLMPMRC